MDIKGIKCDHCDYKDMNIKKEEYLSFVNKPCPQCGHNLLTQKDYEIVMKMDKIFNSKLFKAIDAIFGIFRKPKHFEVKMNGSGKVELKEKDPQ